MDLARALGQDVPPSQVQLVEGTSPGAPPPSAEDLVAQAVQNRPELSDLRFRYQAAQKFEEAERDLKRPNVNLIAVDEAVTIWTRIRASRRRIRGYRRQCRDPDLQRAFILGPGAGGGTEIAGGKSEATQAINSRSRTTNRAAWLTANTAYQRIPVTVELVNEARLAW